MADEKGVRKVLAEGEELAPSRLGTKEYWDEAYNKELQNFKETKDIGEVWFGEDSVERLVAWIEDCDTISLESSIIDLGCGNGYTTTLLAENGFTDLTGVDYSQAAVDLAQALARDKQLKINYQACDILADSQPVDGASVLGRQYDVCLDKGTYDAISLNPDGAALQRRKYVTNVRSLLKEKAVLIITSCNWTEQELRKDFETAFQFVKKIPTPTFQFGGVTGNRETVLVFSKNPL